MAKTDIVFPSCLDEGASGPAVVILQIILCALEFEIECDGMYGKITAMRVKDLQKRLMSPPSGCFDRTTMAVLRSKYPRFTKVFNIKFSNLEGELRWNSESGEVETCPAGIS